PLRFSRSVERLAALAAAAPDNFRARRRAFDRCSLAHDPPLLACTFFGRQPKTPPSLPGNVFAAPAAPNGAAHCLRGCETACPRERESSARPSAALAKRSLRCAAAGIA